MAAVRQKIHLSPCPVLPGHLLTIDAIANLKFVYENADLESKLERHHADFDYTFRHWSDIWLDPRFRAWNMEPLLPAIRAPTLPIQGKHDEYGTMDQRDRISASITVAILPRYERAVRRLGALFASMTMR